ncbi:uncharacterized protein METZ01_LOCUS365181 [marine metagenome]|uniref:Uncharacterized protein n=1 Tax=marine metagenome TaxID=408172 RepID=A0A382SSZ5_9ZZZZ
MSEATAVTHLWFANSVHFSSGHPAAIGTGLSSNV